MGSKIKCNHCGDIIESKARHNIVWCSCNKVAIDGGDEYTRVCGNFDDFTWVEEDKG